MANARGKFFEKIGTRNALACKGIKRGYNLNDLDKQEFYFPEKTFRLSKLARISLRPGIKMADGSLRTETDIFAKPSKMACLSFSLPAGPIDGFGTCPASGYSLQGPEFICNGCYALSGLYMVFPNVALKQQILRAWAEKSVARGTFADEMSACIDHAFSLPKNSKISNRKGVALDVSSTEYFRLHDSGDFFSKGYLRAWCDIAANFPKTKFWAPTRVALSRSNKPNKSWVDEFKRAPKNLIVRPSSLFFEDGPPMIDYMDAGSTVSIGPIKGVHTCPAYKIEAGARSCKNVGCRKCWTQPDVPVTYPAHGDDIARIYTEMGYDMTELKQYWNDFKKGKIAANPPAGSDSSLAYGLPDDPETE